MSKKYEFKNGENKLPDKTLLSLALKSTRKIIRQRGYRGIKKYLYIGFRELGPLFLMTSGRFAWLHDDPLFFDLKKRIKRVELIKGIILGLTFLAVTVITFFLPWNAEKIQILLNLSIAFLSLIIAFFFFGVTVHAVNNFIEERPFWILRYDEFSKEELEKMKNDYDPLNDYSLEAAAKRMLSRGFTMELVFLRHGNGISPEIQEFVGTLYKDALERNNKSAQLDLEKLIRNYYASIDGISIQETFIKVLKTDKTLFDAKLKMLLFFFDLNDKAFCDKEYNYKLSDKVRRVDAQREIARMVLENGEKNSIRKIQEDIFVKGKCGKITALLFLNEYADVFKKSPALYFDLFSAKNKSADRGFKNLNLINMRIKADFFTLSKIMNDDKESVENRLYALFLLSREEYNFSFFKALDCDPDIRYDAYLADDESGRQLIEGSRKLLDDVKKNGFDEKNDYFNSCGIELLYAAAAVVANSSQKKAKLFYTLSRVKYVFASCESAEILGFFGSVADKSESYSVPVTDAEKCIEILLRLACGNAGPVSGDISIRKIEHSGSGTNLSFLDNPPKKR